MLTNESEIYKNNLGNALFALNGNLQIPTLGQDCWWFDSMRIKGNYRASLAGGVNSLGFIDVSGVSTAGWGTGNLCSLGFFGSYRVIQSGDVGVWPPWTDIGTPSLNTTNNASSLILGYRVYFQKYITGSSLSNVMKVMNNAGNGYRIAFMFSSVPGDDCLKVIVGNTSTSYTYSTLGKISATSLKNKWANIIVYMDYANNYLKMWINGALIIATATGITAGNLPNTNSAVTKIYGDDGGFVGYCSYARLTKNGSLTDDQAIVYTHLMEMATLQN